MKRTPRILVMGRPNVGKSTLFNRLLGRRRALVHDLPGVTRDRMEELATWYYERQEVQITLIDTGGLGEGQFSAEIASQVDAGIQEADLLLVVFDGQTGLTAEDREVMRRLQRSGLLHSKPVLGIVNKIDAHQHEPQQAEFYETGLDTLLTVSAEHDRGIDDLKAAALEILKSQIELIPDESEEDSERTVEPESESEPEDLTPRIAIVGRPNVGKSTLINALLGESRMITSPIAGTTVDAVDTPANVDGRDVILIDTAGIRRKSKTEEGVEVLSVIQTKKALERANIAILVLDGETGITDQDEKIGGLIEEAGTSVIIFINKWDTQSKNPEFTREHAAEWVRKEIGFLKYAPILFTSGLKRRGLSGLGDLFDEILSQRSAKVSTKELTEWIRKEAGVHNPLNAKFYLSHQVSRHPPTFICHVSDPEKVHFSLRRHLANGLREKWGFMGTPVRLLFQAGKSNRRAKSASELNRKKAEKREDPRKKAAKRAAARGLKKLARQSDRTR